jgi:hypothetical protein
MPTSSTDPDGELAPTAASRAAGVGLRDALLYCGQRKHLRRTLRIALVVGIVLTAINQLDVIVRGDAVALTYVKCAMNFVVPFVVSNLGLLTGRR